MSSIRIPSKENIRAYCFRLKLWCFKNPPIVVIAIFSSFLTYTLIFGNDPNTGYKEPAELGDSFGLLTCLFSGLAFAAAWHLIMLQKKEMKKLGKHLKKQDRNALTNILVAEWCRATTEANKADDATGVTQRIDKRVAMMGSTIYPELLRMHRLHSDINNRLIRDLVNSDIQHNLKLRLAASEYFDKSMATTSPPNSEFQKTQMSEVYNYFGIHHVGSYMFFGPTENIEIEEETL